MDLDHRVADHRAAQVAPESFPPERADGPTVATPAGPDLLITIITIRA